jgi:murein DD-endopeptidase MepM/ murein hydrolase activator NlpD
MPVDAELKRLKESVASLFGSAFHVSQPYTDEHDGVDIGAVGGTPLRAIAPGKVSYARDATIDDRRNALHHWALGGGNVVNIDIPHNRTIQFAHLESLDVEEGDDVTAGQLIGKVGATGLAHGTHVHFGLWDHRLNEMIKPYDYLASLVADPTNNVTVVTGVQIEDVERFPEPRLFRGRPGGVLRGFDPARPNQVIRQQDAALRAGDPASAIVLIRWPDMDPQPVPHGTFLEVASGFFGGLYVVAAEVDLDPAPG